MIRAVTVIGVVLALVALPAVAQQGAAPPLCATFLQAEAQGLMMEDLMQRHVAAYVPDSDACAFPDKRLETRSAMMDLRGEVQEILDDEDVDKGLVFLQVFYDGDGRIQRVLLRGVEDGLIPAVCARIERLAGTYRYPMASTQPFYNCVTIRRK